MNSAGCTITRSGRKHVKCNGAVKGVTQRQAEGKICSIGCKCNKLETFSKTNFVAVKFSSTNNNRTTYWKCFFNATLWYFAQKLMSRAVSKNNSVFHHILS